MVLLLSLDITLQQEASSHLPPDLSKILQALGSLTNQVDLGEISLQFVNRPEDLVG